MPAKGISDVSFKRYDASSRMIGLCVEYVERCVVYIF